MKVYVFGNPDVEMDNAAIKVAKELEGKVKNMELVFVNPNEDLPFAEEDEVVVMDVVEGIDKVILFSERDVDKLVLSQRSTVHDYDLGFQIRYLRKLGKLGKVKIVGIPMGWETNFAERIADLLSGKNLDRD